MTFFGNAHNDWGYLKKLAREAGDWELYEFAEMMEKIEEKEKNGMGGW